MKQYDEFNEFQQKSDQKEIRENQEEEPPSYSTSDEARAYGYQKLTENLADELIEQIMACSPSFFEQLVIDLSVKTGYGGSLGSDYFDEEWIMQNSDLIIFDLGGVLIQNLGWQKIFSWSTRNLTVNEFNEKWIPSEAFRDFEKGSISEDLFANRLVDKFSLAIGPEELIAEFSGFLIGFHDGTETLLQELA